MFKEKIKQHKTIIENFSYLSLLQLVSLLIPLATYPYLIRVLGKELYGLVVFTQVIAGYFTILIAFGFNYSGVKEVSICRDSKEKLSEIFSSITTIKIIFLLLSFGLTLCYVLFFSMDHKWLYVLAFWTCLYEVVLPTWFFQGIEKMKFITLLTLVSRITFLCLIFFLVKSKDDVLWFPLSNLFGTLVSGLIAIYLVKKEGIVFVLQPASVLWQYIKSSYHFFLSKVFIQIYANSNKAIIGIFLGMSQVAYYDLAEKIVGIFRMPQGILSQTLLPRISMNKNTDFIKKVFKLSVVINIIIYLIIYFGADYFVLFLGGEAMLPAVPVLRIIGLLAPVIAISNVMGVLTLIPFNYNKEFSKMIFISVVSYFIMIGIVWGLGIISINSLSITTVLVEIVVSIISVYYVLKNKILWGKNTIT